MHHTALYYADKFFQVYLKEKNNEDLVIVEVGSQDVNGSIREVAPKSAKYIGLDFLDGKGVDVVIQNEYEYPLEDSYADVLVSSSCLEHSQFFWLAFLEMCRVVKPGGYIYMNVPSNGIFHRYPVDCWCFYPDAGNALASWAKHNNYEIELVESFIGEQTEDAIWNDFVAVFHKKGNIEKPEKLDKLISNSVVDIRNIHTVKGLDNIQAGKPNLLAKEKFKIKLYISENDGSGFNENRMLEASFKVDQTIYNFKLPADITEQTELRLDISDGPVLIDLINIIIHDNKSDLLWKWNGEQECFTKYSGVAFALDRSDGKIILCTNNDPQFVLNLPAEVFKRKNESVYVYIAMRSVELSEALPHIPEIFSSPNRFDHVAAINNEILNLKDQEANSLHTTMAERVARITLKLGVFNANIQSEASFSKIRADHKCSQSFHRNKKILNALRSVESKIKNAKRALK